MPHEKTSQAKYKSIRFNPGTSVEDREALALVTDLETQGYNFHQIVVDAILRAGDWTPEMFPKPNTPDMIGMMEGLLSNFAQEIIAEIHRGGIRINEGEIGEPQEDTSEFVNNFARTFMQRQQRALGDKE